MNEEIILSKHLKKKNQVEKEGETEREIKVMAKH